MNLPHGNIGDILLWEKTVRETVRGIHKTTRQDVSLGKQMVLKEGTGRQDSIAAATGPSMHLKGKLLLGVLSLASSLR